MLSRTLLMSGLLLLASACAHQVEVKPLYPSHADLRVESEPVPTDAIVTDAEADERFRAGHEAWGRRGWAAVARICRQVEAWEDGRQLPFDCPRAGE